MEGTRKTYLLPSRPRKGKPLTRLCSGRNGYPVPSKLKAVGKWLMVVSLCGAIGLHWVALQSIAWAGMLISNARCGSLVTAVANTFDGQHPCPLCKAIAKGEQGGKKQDMQLGGGRIDMEFRRQPALLFPPRKDQRWPSLAFRACARSTEPVLPPPKLS